MRVDPDQDFVDGDYEDEEILAEHGHLWFRVEDSERTQEVALLLAHPVHEYRSLATGFVSRWYDHEVQTINDTEELNDG